MEANVRIHVNDTDLYVDVEGVQLRVNGNNLVERPTILVLHGGPGFDQGYLRPGLGALSADAQMVFIDLRGQGRSGRPPLETCTLEQMADDVAGLCALLGIDAPLVFGHSAGGFVALHLALRHPSLVGGLILCDTAPTLTPIPDDDPPPSLAQRASAEAGRAAARMFGGDFSAESVANFNRLVGPFYAAPHHMEIPGNLLSLSNFSGDIAQYFFAELAPRFDLRPHLADIHVPTQVIVGQHDWVCPPAASRALAGGIPDARLNEIPGAGHFPFSEEPDAFLVAARQLLGRATLGRQGSPRGQQPLHAPRAGTPQSNGGRQPPPC